MINASIEAARAGENGRGFAVVADEIKKLAENTTSQVQVIQTTVAQLIQKVNTTSSVLDGLTSSFAGSKNSIHNAVESIHGMNESLAEIGNNFMEISSNTEEQTAASQEMSGNLMIINDKSKGLRDEVVRTGKSFFEISTLIDEIRLIGFDHAQTLDPKVQIEVCKCDHLMWRWRVYNMILGNVVLDEQEVGTHKTCRLGKWIEKQTNLDNQGLHELLGILEQPHSDLHTLAKKAIKEYKGNKITAAEETLLQMDDCSKSVIHILNKIKELY